MIKTKKHIKRTSVAAVTVTLPFAILDELEAAKKRTHQSRSMIVSTILERYLRGYKAGVAA